jgi:arylsulfatase A-like enzyme
LNVILLVIDTLRADHLGCYGYQRQTSPNIDRLAKESILFENAYPSDVPTQPSFTSMFTGLRGIHTGIVSHSKTEELSEDVPYLTEILAQNGVTTAAVSTLYMMRRWFARGFHHYLNPVAGNRRRLQQVDADEINGFALPWIREHRKESFFLFLHYWDPHGLYKPPEEYRRLFYDGDETDPDNHSLDALKKHPIWPFTKRHVDAIGEGITDLEYVIAQYDAEIRYADDHVKLLLDALEEAGIAGETVVMITSDHGESMGEHHFYFDHHGVYETTIRVPLIIRHPQETSSGQRVGDLVQSTISISPTVLSLFGLEAPRGMKGKDLFEVASKEEPGWREIYSNQGLWTAKRAVRTEEWKLIKTTHKAFWDTPDTELFRIDADPQETENLAEDEPDVVDRLELRMSRWLKDELQGRVDPLELILSHGLPVYDWVEIAARQTGLLESYEEWRMKIDRAETVRKGPRDVSPPRW